MNKIMLICFALLPSSINSFAQNNIPYNVHLRLSSNNTKIKLDSIWDFQIFYTLENLSDNICKIDTLDIPNFEDNEIDKINFKFYYKDSKKGYKLYPVYPKDVQVITDLSTSSMITLKPHEKYMYQFRLFNFYEVQDKGLYRIYASYRVMLPKKRGYYLQISQNYIDVVIQ